jgi:hypothetical protein
VLRTLGRWYGRAGRLKQELLSEFTKAADLPTPGPGVPLTLRGSLLGLDPLPTRVSGIPAVVTTPPSRPSAPLPEPTPLPWTGGYPTPTWSTTVPIVADPREVSR